jgi:HAD superfamily hydrolase (TIGR01509 family)
VTGPGGPAGPAAADPAGPAAPPPGAATAGRPLAAVFDMDGTLVDNMRFHGEAWERLARRLGSAATREDFERRWAGKKSGEILPMLLGRPLPDGEAARLAAEKEADYRAAYGPLVAPVAGLLPFLDRLRAAGLRLALATAAPAENRAMVLAALGLGGAFEVSAGPEDAARGKPFPDLFLAASRRLAVPADRCVAFEDAANGVRAARAAGMAVVGISTGEAARDLLAAGARFAAPDYASLPEACLAWLTG